MRRVLTCWQTPRRRFELGELSSRQRLASPQIGLGDLDRVLAAALLAGSAGRRGDRQPYGGRIQLCPCARYPATCSLVRSPLSVTVGGPPSRSVARSRPSRRRRLSSVQPTRTDPRQPRAPVCHASPRAVTESFEPIPGSGSRPMHPPPPGPIPALAPRPPAWSCARPLPTRSSRGPIGRTLPRDADPPPASQIRIHQLTRRAARPVPPRPARHSGDRVMRPRQLRVRRRHVVLTGRGRPWVGGGGGRGGGKGVPDTWRLFAVTGDDEN